MSWITETKNFVSVAYFKVGGLVFVSSGVFMFPWLFYVLGLKPHYDVVMKTYDAHITIALVVSFWLLVTGGIYKLWEWWSNRKAKLKIISATYGVGRHHNDVTHIVKDMIKKQGNRDRLKIKVDDENFLERRKVDDPVPGSPKTLKIEYEYRFSEEYQQGDLLNIAHI